MIYQYDTTFRPLHPGTFSGILSRGEIYLGDQEELLRGRLKKITGCRHVFLVTSGTDALHLALLALGIARSPEVLIPSYACQQILNAVMYAGGKPRFADIHPDNYSMDIRLALKSATAKTGAAIVPYMFGDIVRIKPLAAQGIPVIENLAHAIGGVIDGKKMGSIGTIGITSFGDRKYVDGGFGGAIFTNRADLAKKIGTLLSPCGSAYRINYKYKMPNLVAAILNEKIPALPESIKRRKTIAAYYLRHFKKAGVPCKYRSSDDSLFHRFIIHVAGDKKRFIRNMAARGVACGVGVDTPLHKMLGHRQKLPQTELAAKTGVALPIRPNLRKHEIDKILAAVYKCL